MERRSDIAIKHINRQIEWAKEELEEERELIAKRAKTASAETLISLAQSMRETERKIHALHEQLEVVMFIKEDTFVTE